MRIVSGKYRGKRIVAPKSLPVRPTTDMAKESLFNILRNEFDFEQLDVLDLFAGTGSISYEFASRGAKQITSVDRDFGCIKFIKKTANELGATNLKAVKYDVFKFLPKCYLTFDIIFADPPYALDNIPEIAPLVFKHNLLNDGGWLIVEHPKEVDLSTQEHYAYTKQYGHVNFSIFSKD